MLDIFFHLHKLSVATWFYQCIKGCVKAIFLLFLDIKISNTYLLSTDDWICPNQCSYFYGRLTY